MGVVYDMNNWIILNGSVPGSRHKRQNIPCQDFSGHASLGAGWHIAVISDGAGSKKNSAEGSRITVERFIVNAKSCIVDRGWFKSRIMPENTEWGQILSRICKTVKEDLILHSKERGVDLQELAATVMTAVFNQNGAAVGHIGDGRMAIRFTDGDWVPGMKPFRGQFSNQTVFLTSNYWEENPEAISSRVYSNKISAIALLTDGCENAAFHWSNIDSTGKWEDVNRPHINFFEPLFNQALSFQNMDRVELRQKLWIDFLESGTPKLKQEPDDKTIFFACLKS